MGTFWIYSKNISDKINEEWGERFVKKQIMFDKSRTLLPIIREITRVKQMASERAIIDMASNEMNQDIHENGIKTLEKYRRVFEDRSYFAAFLKTRHYYYNDTSERYNPEIPRYTLSSSNNNDSWFYATLGSTNEIEINVDKDYVLGVTKIWLNCLVRDNHGKVVGVVGTGFNFDQFVNESVAIEQEGIVNYFIDSKLAIQLAKDTKVIDFASITKKDGQHKSLYNLLEDKRDIELIKQAMKRVKSANASDTVETLWVTFEGKTHLLGISYLKEIGWYNLTFIDSKELVLVNNMNVLIVFGAIFLIMSILLNLILSHIFIQPLNAIKKAMNQIEHGEYNLNLPVIGSGEIADLSIHLNQMVAYVRLKNDELENRVQERTKEIQHLAFYDVLTQLPNRRLLNDRLTQALVLSKRSERYGAVMFLDLDNFKPLNDLYGHNVGDLLLVEVAIRIKKCLRELDTVARFGGDEFVVLLSELSVDKNESFFYAQLIAEKIRTSLENIYILKNKDEIVEHHCTASIGATLFYNHEEEKENIIKLADKAMYDAKEAGRNQVRFI